MALAFGPHRRAPADRTGQVAGFVLGFAAGLVLTAILTLHVWPALLPYGERLVPDRAAVGAAVVMGLVCGLAADVMVTARRRR
jgi:hypothetical protein